MLKTTRHIVASLAVAAGLLLAACSSSSNQATTTATPAPVATPVPAAQTIKVGTIAGPETALMQVAADVAKKEFNLNVQIVTFSDYLLPNEALADGSIDANAFQHKPFLDSQIAARHYQLVPVGNTFVYPMGLYSTKIHSLAALKKGAEVAIPNDPSNEARALLLLQKADLIKLKPGVSTNATLPDVIGNPKNLKIVELDAAQIPRSMPDVALAAMNTNFSIPAGFKPSQAIFMEGPDSPYMNLIVARTNNASSPAVQELVKAYQSAPVVAKAKELFGEAAIAGFTVGS